jgi:hypothetical protein
VLVTTSRTRNERSHWDHQRCRRNLANPNRAAPATRAMTVHTTPAQALRSATTPACPVFLKHALPPLGRWAGQVRCQIGLRKYHLMQIVTGPHYGNGAT